MSEYEGIVRLVNSGLSLTQALDKQGISRSHFSRKRCISEAAKVNMTALRSAMVSLRKVTLPTIYPAAKDICNLHFAELRELHSRGHVLAPKERY